MIFAIVTIKLYQRAEKILVATRKFPHQRCTALRD